MRFLEAIISISLIVLIAIALISPSSAKVVNGPMLVAAPVNPDLIAYYNTPAPLRDKGYIPPIVDLSHLKGKKLAGVEAMEKSKTPAVKYPVSYDLRTLGRVTPVRDQGSSGSCWAFGAYGSLESFLRGGDFSENNLKNTHGYDWGPNDGGNNLISSAYLTRWAGPVNETDDPYDPTSTSSPTGLSVQKHAQDIVYIPARSSATDLSNLKYYIMNYGAVASSMYFDAAYYKPSKMAYYYPERGRANGENHEVAIVGWDDRYSKSNFTPMPPGNGAFIVKNSWGSSWGDKGYFYVSYYDKYLGKDNAVFTAEATTNYHNVYQYDAYGWIGTYGYTGYQSGWIMNNYVANRSENLEAVGFYVPEVNASGQVRVLLNDRVMQVTNVSTLTPGYHTVKLNKPVHLDTGSRFSVQLNLVTPGYGYPMCVEVAAPGYCSSPTAHPGESYMSYDGESWTDTTSLDPTMNVCLKAYAA